MILSFLLLLVDPAAALDLRWWGIGPTIGTMALPTKYPAVWPAAVEEDPARAVEKVRGDAEFGAHAVLYPGTAGRIFAFGTLGVGSAGWVRPEFVVGYDGILVKDEEFQLLFGAGLGAGSERFHDAERTTYLRANYFPIQAQLSALLRDRSRAYEVSILGNYHIVTGQESCLADGVECVPGKGASTIAGAAYFGVGAQATLYFGDFRSKGGTKKD